MREKIKKLIPYCLILIAIIGFGFLSAPNTRAQGTGGNSSTIPPNSSTIPPATTTSPTPTPPQTDFEQQFDTATICYTGVKNGIVNVGGCLVSVAYYIFYGFASWVLALSAKFFNALIAISLSSALFTKSAFVSTAWEVVRDLSNIFFILILLYVAVQMILGIGHGGKKTIAQVIIIALLINFSMFFTKIVIDASNVLALVFYNKLEVVTEVDGKSITYAPVTSENDKDLSGAMVSSFDPTSSLTWNNFFERARQPTQEQILGTKGRCVPFGGFFPAGWGWDDLFTREECAKLDVTAEFVPVSINPDGLLSQVPSGIMLGIILVSGTIMFFAAYCFFVAGLSFLGRMIELWILIIFSPFAFMSSTVPVFAHMEYLGWDAWLKRIFEVAFMAPIFMFFLYFIFLLINAKPFDNVISSNGMIEVLLTVLVPALVILTLLIKATAFAKKGGGVIAEKLIMGAKMAGGLALGAGAVGVAAGAYGARSTVGRFSASTTQSEKAVKYGEARRKAEVSYGHALENWKKAGGAKPEWKAHLDTRVVAAGLTSSPSVMSKDYWGGRINAAQLKKQEVSHASHEMADLNKKAGIEEGTPESNVSGVQLKAREEAFNKENRAEVNADIVRGEDKKGKAVTITFNDLAGVSRTVAGKDKFDGVMRDQLSEQLKADPAAITRGDAVKDKVTGVTTLTTQGNEKIKTQLNERFTEAQKTKTTAILSEKYEHLQSESREKVGLGTKVVAATPSGSYDPRGLVGMKANKIDSIGVKASMGIVAAVAMGIRSGLKQVGGGYDGSEPKKDLFMDLKEIVTGSIGSAFKNANLKIDLGGGGHGGAKKADDHGHGGGGHGGGHH